MPSPAQPSYGNTSTPLSCFSACVRICASKRTQAAHKDNSMASASVQSPQSSGYLMPIGQAIYTSYVIYVAAIALQVATPASVPFTTTTPYQQQQQPYTFMLLLQQLLPHSATTPPPSPTPHAPASCCQMPCRHLGTVYSCSGNMGSCLNILPRCPFAPSNSKSMLQNPGPAAPQQPLMTPVLCRW
jgi:hypothetical protein